MQAFIQTAFNTGRHYTAKGQRIAARLLSHELSYDHTSVSGVVALVDADRGIQGLYRVSCVRVADCLLPETIMRAYDHDARAIGFRMDYEAERELFDALREIAHSLA